MNFLSKRFGQNKPPVGSQIDWGHPLARGLVGCWLLNEGAGGKAHDLSGNNNHGVLTNFAFPSTPTSGWNPGRTGISLSFDGVDDYVKIPNAPSLDPTEEITVMAWLFLRGTTGTVQNAVRKESQYLIGWINSSYEFIRWYISTAGVLKFMTCSKTPTELQGNWFHFAETYKSNGEFKGYLNGVLDNSTTLDANPIDTTNNVLYLGREPGGAYWNGLIDEVRIYNRALTSEEIEAHFLGARVPKVRQL